MAAIRDTPAPKGIEQRIKANGLLDLVDGESAISVGGPRKCGGHDWERNSHQIWLKIAHAPKRSSFHAGSKKLE